VFGTLLQRYMVEAMSAKNDYVFLHGTGAGESLEHRERALHRSADEGDVPDSGDARAGEPWEDGRAPGERILQQVCVARQLERAAFRVPWRFSGKGRFEQIRFDA